MPAAVASKPSPALTSPELAAATQASPAWSPETSIVPVAAATPARDARKWAVPVPARNEVCWMNANSQNESAPNMTNVSSAVAQSVNPTIAFELRRLSARLTIGMIAKATAPATRKRNAPSRRAPSSRSAVATSTRMTATGRNSAIENRLAIVSSQSGAVV